MTRSDHSMTGVYVLIGATTELGSATTRDLTTRGARTVLGSADESALELLAREVEGRAYPMDMTHYEQVKWIIDYAKEAFGQIDGVATFMGPARVKPPHLTTPEEFQAGLHKSVTAAFYTIRAAVRAMMHSGGGSILLASSATPADPGVHGAIDAASAAAIEALARCSTETYRRHGIRLRLLRSEEAGCHSGRQNSQCVQSLAAAASRWLSMRAADAVNSAPDPTHEGPPIAASLIHEGDGLPSGARRASPEAD